MTHIELAIREAVEKGEWMSAFLEGMTVEQIENWTSHVWAAEAFLDPLFWQALGKVRGWWDETHLENLDVQSSPETYWLKQWHRFIDHLASGGDAESFFQSLELPAPSEK